MNPAILCRRNCPELQNTKNRNLLPDDLDQFLHFTVEKTKAQRSKATNLRSGKAAGFRDKQGQNPDT